MLRFFVTGLDRPELWSRILSRIQSILNSSTSTSTEKSLNEINYDFKSNQSLNLVAASASSELKSSIARISVADALAFVSMSAKYYYNKDHTSKYFKKETSVFLRLHKEYNIFVNVLIIKKLDQQYTRLFKILKKVDRLAYELDIPTHWRIHFVVTIAMLEPISGSDSYKRFMSSQSDFVYVEDDTAISKFWEVDRIVNKRKDRYLLRWKEWDS